MISIALIYQFMFIKYTVPEGPKSHGANDKLTR
jgi:hypothetical protein